MIINTNVSSITAQEAATNTGKSIKSSLEKLSTGLKINKASDDASGLAIADKLRTQATSIDQGVANGNSAVTLLQIADKSMAEQSNILDTVKAKLIQANTDTTSSDGREAIRKDIAKLLEQLDNIAEQTNYNGNILLQAAADDLGASGKLNFQIGESNSDIIENSAVQSNTKGLGSQTVYSAENENNTIAAGSTTELASAGTISLTSNSSSGENASETVSLSGDVDTIALKVGMTISGMDSVTQAALVSQFTGGDGVDYTKAGDTFTMIAEGNLDLSLIDNVNATVTTPSESTNQFVPAEGDIITASTTNTGSKLATALLDDTQFTANTNGTYTAKAGIEAITLEANESVNFSQSSGSIELTDADVIDFSASTVVPGSALANEIALAELGTSTVMTKNADGDYELDSAASFNLENGESIVNYTESSVGGIEKGDYIDATTLVSGSDLHTALNDATKFDNVSGTIYKALTDEYTAADSLDLVQTEAIKKTDSTSLTETGLDFAVGSQISVTDRIVGGDLDNQLRNTEKFTAGDTNHDANTVYTVKADFTTEELFVGSGEVVSITPTVEMDVSGIAASGAALEAMLAEGTMEVNGATGFYLDPSIEKIVGTDVNDGSGVTEVAAPGSTVKMTLTATGTEALTFKAGDTVTGLTEAGTTAALQPMATEMLESGDWVDNGAGSYTYAGAGTTVNFAAAGDSLTLTTTIGVAQDPTEITGPVAQDINSTNKAAEVGSVTTNTVSPSATVSLDVTTDSTLNATNNGNASDTLTISGDSEISNGGTQLSSIAAIGSGQLTATLASDFQAVIDDAITDLNGYRGDIGSTQNQVESAVRNLMTQSTNVKAAESIIRDVDYAQESANFNKQNIISQAGSYAISQANSVQQNVLKLLQ